MGCRLKFGLRTSRSRTSRYTLDRDCRWNMRNALGLMMVVVWFWQFAAPQSGLANGDDSCCWLAAAGAVIITPTEPLWMGGYAARDKPSDGKVHDLFAKVLVVEDLTGHRLVIVTADLLGITRELRTAIETQVQQYGVGRGNLLLNASHTHCGPELRSDRLLRLGIDARYAALSQQYVRLISKRIAKLVGEVVSRIEPARLVYSYARAGFAMNRRLPTEKGFINSPNPDGPTDHQVPVLRVENAAGELKSILFGYACHATTLSIQQLCGDYPGFAQQYLEEAHPGVVALFMNGCSADQNPYPRRTLDLARQHGRALANGVETALMTKNQKQLRGSLKVDLQNVTLRFADPPTRSELEKELASGNKYIRIHAQGLLDELDARGEIQIIFDHFPIQVAQFGNDLTLVGICGEAVVDYSLRCKKELSGNSGNAVWVAGYCNDVFGYLPSKRVLLEGGYEAGAAMRYTRFPGPFDESVESRIVAGIHELVLKVRSE